MTKKKISKSSPKKIKQVGSQSKTKNQKVGLYFPLIPDSDPMWSSGFAVGGSYPSKSLDNLQKEDKKGNCS